MMDSSERLKAARMAAGYASATEAARAFGWPPSTYMGHENGSRGLNLDAAHKYAKAFGVDWAYLMTGKASEWVEEGSTEGTPLLGPLGVRPNIPNRRDAPKIPVGVEGYKYEELVAFISQAGPPTEYVICYTGPHDVLLLGDEVIISTDVPGRGRSYETWVVDEVDRDLFFIPTRLLDVGSSSRLPAAQFFDLPGFRAEGMVVAVYEDKKRRRAIKASGVLKTS